MLVLFLINTLITSTEFAGIAAASEIFHVSALHRGPACIALAFSSSSCVSTTRSSSARSSCFRSSISRTSFPRSWHTPTGTRCARHVRSQFQLRTAGWLTMVVGDHRHDDLAVHAILSSVRRRRKRFARRRSDARAHRRHQRIASGDRARGLHDHRQRRDDYVANKHGAHLHPQQAADFAVALKPLAGPLAEVIFALGILNAGLFTATVLPLSTSYIICEALGFEAAIDRKFSRSAGLLHALRSGSGHRRGVRADSGHLRCCS